jgi:hypothetical protein
MAALATPDDPTASAASADPMHLQLAYALRDLGKESSQSGPGDGGGLPAVLPGAMQDSPAGYGEDVAPAPPPGASGVLPASAAAVPTAAVVAGANPPGVRPFSASAMAAQMARPPNPSAPDPLAFASQRTAADQTPPGFFVDPYSGAVSRPRNVPTNDPLHPWQVSLDPVTDQQKQDYLERTTGARAEYPLGAESPQEQDQRLFLNTGLAPGVKDWAKLPAPDKGEKQLLDLVAEKELLTDTGSKRFASAYDIPYGYGTFEMPQKPLTQMTLGELDGYETKLHQKSGGPTAVGKYHFTQDTLRYLKNALRLDDTDKFTPELQDRLGLDLLKAEGVDDYRAKRISPSQFQNNLANRWATIPIYSTGLNRGKRRGQPMPRSKQQ